MKARRQREASLDKSTAYEALQWLASLPYREKAQQRLPSQRISLWSPHRASMGKTLCAIVAGRRVILRRSAEKRRPASFVAPSATDPSTVLGEGSKVTK